MARSRNIKPGFFKNENLVELRYEVRLLFIGLWTLADKKGRLEDRPKKIKMELFPADDINIEEAISELVRMGFALRYEVENIKYIQILNFDKHQRPHHQEQDSVIPDPLSSHQGTSEPRTNRSDSLNLIPDSLNTDSRLLIAEGQQPPPELIIEALQAFGIPKLFCEEQWLDCLIYYKGKNLQRNALEAAYKRWTEGSWKRKGHDWTPGPKRQQTADDLIAMFNEEDAKSAINH